MAWATSWVLPSCSGSKEPPCLGCSQSLRNILVRAFSRCFLMVDPARQETMRITTVVMYPANPNLSDRDNNEWQDPNIETGTYGSSAPGMWSGTTVVLERLAPSRLAMRRSL